MKNKFPLFSKIDLLLYMRGINYACSPLASSTYCLYAHYENPPSTWKKGEVMYEALLALTLLIILVLVIDRLKTKG